MAITTADYSPVNRNPDFANEEWQQVHIIGDGTLQVFDGHGYFADVINNVAVAGTVSIHDMATGGTPTAANRIALYDTTALGALAKAKKWIVESGLAIITSAATNDVTIQIRGRATVSTRTFPPAGRGGALYY